MRKNLLVGYLIGLFLLGLGGIANASLIEWKFDATFSAVTTDPLGIDGESVSLNLINLTQTATSSYSFNLTKHTLSCDVS